MSSIQLEDCIVDNVGLDRLLSKIPNLLRFDLGYSPMVGYNYYGIEGRSSIMQSLIRYSYQSLAESPWGAR